MDETTEKTPKRRKRLPRRLRLIIAAVTTAALILLALLAFIYRDYLTEEGLRDLFGGGSSAVAGEEPFTYESGAEQVFALAGDGLAIASTTGLQLLNSDGYSVARQVFSMDSPAVAASSVHAAFFDVGGKALRVADFDGACTTLDTDEPIISVSMNDAGWLAVCTEELGYKGQVTVYNEKLEPVYRWHSGTGWLLKAVLSPDCTRLCAVCAQADGGALRFFSLSSEDEQGSFQAPGQLLVDAEYHSGGVCAISESAAYFTDDTGGNAKSFEFGDAYLADYALSGGDYMAVYLSRYRGGGGGELISIDYSGDELGRAEIQSSVSGMYLRQRDLLAWGPDGLTRYSRSMSPAAADSGVAGIKYALYRQSGDVLLISSYAAEIFTF